jgi:uncharacterized protein
MNFDPEKRTILMVRHGSHAYGLNTPSSDVDIKGICIEPREYHLGFMHAFEQHESKKGEEDKVIYSLKKFSRLAADSNPNIIEILHGAPEDVLKIDSFSVSLKDHKYEFLSKKARFTFAGYAHAQLKRIKTHRSWLLSPPKNPPSRSDAGLPEESVMSKSDLGAFEKVLGEDHSLELSKDVMTLYVRERQYQAAYKQWKQYQNWLGTRNPARAELEAKFGYDTKHGMHLLRLMRMCKEILETGKVIVKRPDREELLDVRNGRRSYDSLIEETERLEGECEELYRTSALPKNPDRQKLDDIVIELTEEYLRLHG